MGRPRDHEATALVLKTTFDLLDEDSFAHLTVQKIADRSGVAKTTIYRRWPNVASIVMDAFLSEIRTGNTNRVNNLTWAKKNTDLDNSLFPYLRSSLQGSSRNASSINDFISP